MSFTNILMIVLILAIVAFSVWNTIQTKKKADENQAKAEAMKAEQAAAWANDYRNPASANYDPARVATETAAQEPDPAN